MKISVAGTGYVGLSNAIILAQHNEVFAIDVVPSKVDLINNKKSPISDKEIEDYLKNKKLNRFLFLFCFELAHMEIVSNFPLFGKRECEADE